MGRSFDTLRRTGGTVPRIQELQYEPGQTFKDRALVVLNVNGNVQECGANPAAVTGVALNGVGTLPGNNLANDNLVNVRTGLRTRSSVAIADKEQEFSARGVNGVVDPVIPLQSHIGQQFGVIKVVNDWCINFADQINVVVQITDIFNKDGKNFFACKIIDAVATLP